MRSPRRALVVALLVVAFFAVAFFAVAFFAVAFFAVAFLALDFLGTVFFAGTVRLPAAGGSIASFKSVTFNLVRIRSRDH